MNENYYIVKDDLIEALNHIENFDEKMQTFTVKHPKYSYSIKLNRLEDGKWETEIEIRTKDEHGNQKTS